jgi:hypothetical protein
MVDYGVRVLGLPWSHAPALVWFGRLAGLLCLAASGWLLIKTSLQTPAPDRLQRIGAALILMALLTAAAAGAVRYDFAPERETPPSLWHLRGHGADRHPVRRLRISQILL